VGSGITGFGYGRTLYRKYGKLRTNDFAVMAVYTLLGLYNNRRMITLLVEFCRKFKRLLGAILDTVSTSLTSILQNVHDAQRDLYAVRVKWNPPKIHIPFSGCLGGLIN
jgi:hypothetical protein